MSASSVLTANGVLRADDVVVIAAIAGLELAAAATLLVKESSGGRNVWGGDNVRVAPNTYVKGGSVTEANYTAYVAAVRAGRAGRQGCGPTQLTSGVYQQRADDAGGCWRWEVNAQVGFEILADFIARRGVQNGFRAYNGSAAYGRDAKARYDVWRARLENEEDDMAIADDIAAAVWRFSIRNGFGDTVEAQQILAGSERRIADVQQALAALTAQIAALRSAGVADDDIRRAIDDGLDTETL